MGLKFLFLLPIFELLIFILFGDFFGFFPVIFSIFFTGIIGLFFLRTDIKSSNIENIALNPKEWIYKKIAGILLLIPGFLTDLIGVLLLFRSIRSLIWDFIPKKTTEFFYKEKNKNSKEDIIEVDYKDLDDK